MPVRRCHVALDEPVQRTHARVRAAFALVVDPAVQLIRAIEVKAVEERPAIFSDCVFQPAVANGQVEIVRIARNRCGVEADGFGVSDQRRAAEILSQRIQELGE